MWLKIGADVLNLQYVESIKLREKIVRVFSTTKMERPQDVAFSSEKEAQEKYDELVARLEKGDGLFEIRG
jgi:hypothetical protein